MLNKGTTSQEQEAMFLFPGLMDSVYSKDKRHKRFYLLLIGGIVIREMAQQKPLFLRQLDPKSEGGHWQAQPAMQPADLDGRAEAHHQQSRVNGMPHKTIRPGANQLVVLLERDIAAPISSERAACPEREEQSVNTNQPPPRVVPGPCAGSPRNSSAAGTADKPASTIPGQREADEPRRTTNLAFPQLP